MNFLEQVDRVKSSNMVVMDTLTLQMTLVLGFLPAVGSSIVFGPLDVTTRVFNTGGTPYCL